MYAESLETLIEAVRKRQALYDKGHKDYSNRVFLNQQWNWKEAAEEIGTNSEF